MLNNANRAASQSLRQDETSILRTVLLMQAISEGTHNTLSYFVPNEKNLELSFNGVDNMQNGVVTQVAYDLCNRGLLSSTNDADGTVRFSTMMNTASSADIETKKHAIIDGKHTSDLIAEGGLQQMIEPSGFAAARFDIQVVPADDVREREVNKDVLPWQIKVMAAVAKDDKEGKRIENNIHSLMDNDMLRSGRVIIVDASSSPLGLKELESYADAVSRAEIYRQIDIPTSERHKRSAAEVLDRWKSRILSGRFTVYAASGGAVKSDSVTGVDSLLSKLREADLCLYPNGLETGTAVLDNMWSTEHPNFRQGAECGANEEVKGTFKSNNPNMQLSTFIGKSVWRKDKDMNGNTIDAPHYWETEPSLLISRIKLCAQSVIQPGFDHDWRVSMADIYDALVAPPFGFMPCNLTAFVLGFVLKEYCRGEYRYCYGDDSKELYVDKLKDMVKTTMDAALEYSKGQTRKQNEYYIVMRTDEERAFDAATSKIFDVDADGRSMETVRALVCGKMKELRFPVWTLKHTDASGEVKRLVDLYSELANPNNAMGRAYTEVVKEIGAICKVNSALVDDAAAAITMEHCKEGMTNYLNEAEGGLLPRLSSEIGADTGRMMTDVQKKFSSGESKWLWSFETGQEMIKEVITEYSIAAESNKYVPPTHSFEAAVGEWMGQAHHIKLCCEMMKGKVSVNLDALLKMLAEIQRGGGVTYLHDSSRRQQFLNVIRSGGAEYKEFYSDQCVAFRSTCGYYLDDDQYHFDESEVKSIYAALPDDGLIRSKTEVTNAVERTVEDFAAKRSGERVRQLWLDKTSKKSPIEWARDYQMPVECLFPEGRMAEAEEAVEAASALQVDNDKAEKALSFFNSEDAAKMFDRMRNPQERDDAFRKHIIGGYDVILDDAEEVRKEIEKKRHIVPDKWFKNDDVAKCVREMAQAKYDEGACNKALEKIDKMGVDTVKQYLKDLIADMRHTVVCRT